MAFITRTKAAVVLSANVNRFVFFKKLRPLCKVSPSHENIDKQPIKNMKDIPGPVSLPVIGTVWKFFVGARGEPLGKRILALQAELVNKYGRIYRTQLPGRTIVNLGDPSDVAKVLRSESKYPQRLKLPHLEYYREKRQKLPGVFFADGPEWYKHRSVISKRMLRPKEVAEYAKGFNGIIADFVHRLRSVREPLGSENESEVQGLDTELFKWSFESVAEVLFDKRFGCLRPEANIEAQAFIKAIGDFLYYGIIVGFLPMWFYKIYETRQFKLFFDSFDTMYEYAELFIARRIEELEEQEKMEMKVNEGEDGKKAGFFEFLLSSGKLSKDDLLASVIDVLFAGVDTTSNTMQWVLYMMAKNPDKQEILRQEVLSVLGDSEQASPATLARMPYLKACVRETLRLYPVLSTIPRISSSDLILSGYHIPAGTRLGFISYYMSRDESVFENAAAFKPERWLREKDNKHLKEEIDAFSSTPFGFGTRMCVGRRIAELELHLLLARTVQEFEIHYPSHCDDVEPFMRGVTIPDRPVRVKFVDRKK